MAEFYGDSKQLRVYRQFIEEIEMALRAANREIIGEQIPELDKECFSASLSRWPSLRAN